jgi:iron complex transport system permease protein
MRPFYGKDKKEGKAQSGDGPSATDRIKRRKGMESAGTSDEGNFLSVLKRGYGRMKDDMSRLDDNESEIARKKRRFRVICVFGIVMSLVAFLISISISSGGVIPVSEAFSAMLSALKKGGEGLNIIELYIYQSRLPRVLAAIAVGAGLAIAGCMFQAIIRNPLVDPYITGVSSGAGCFVIAIVALGISLPFIGDNSLYFIPVAAIMGGLIAFGINMTVAEKAGGSAINYILAGVIVGFAFASVQTVFMSMAKDTLPDVMWWLYGSFANVTWENAWLVFIPAMGIALISMIWAREFNLFMMGEDQAKQLGLNVRLFKIFMMVIASVLTAVCVAFCGIIGFVGLVIPHACRMALGGDHRLIMPASIVLGAMLMLFADLVARTAMSPLELPVGAITAMIGTPVFAYMLMRKGREYDG